MISHYSPGLQGYTFLLLNSLCALGLFPDVLLHLAALTGPSWSFEGRVYPW